MHLRVGDPEPQIHRRGEILLIAVDGRQLLRQLHLVAYLQIIDPYGPREPRVIEGKIFFEAGMQTELGGMFIRLVISAEDIIDLMPLSVVGHLPAEVFIPPVDIETDLHERELLTVQPGSRHHLHPETDIRVFAQIKITCLVGSCVELPPDTEPEVFIGITHKFQGTVLHRARNIVILRDASQHVGPEGRIFRAVQIVEVLFVACQSGRRRCCPGQDGFMALRDATHAQLTMVVGAPGIDVPLVVEGHRVHGSAAHGHDIFPGQVSAGIDFDGHTVPEGGLCAQLAIVVHPTGVQPAVIAQGQTMLIACCNSTDLFAFQHAAGIHRHRHLAVCRAVVAQLTIGVLPPGVQVTFVIEGHGKELPCRDLHDLLSFQHSTGVHGHRHVDHLFVAASPQGPMVVDAPAVEMTLLVEGHDEPQACRHRYYLFSFQHPRGIDDTGFTGVVVVRLVAQAIPQHAEIVPPPGIHPVVFGDGIGVVVTGSNVDHFLPCQGSCSDRTGIEAVVEVAAAQRPVIVMAPGVEHSVGVQGHTVVVAGGQGDDPLARQIARGGDVQRRIGIGIVARAQGSAGVLPPHHHLTVGSDKPHTVAPHPVGEMLGCQPARHQDQQAQKKEKDLSFHGLSSYKLILCLLFHFDRNDPVHKDAVRPFTRGEPHRPAGLVGHRASRHTEQVILSILYLLHAGGDLFPRPDAHVESRLTGITSFFHAAPHTGIQLPRPLRRQQIHLHLYGPFFPVITHGTVIGCTGVLHQLRPAADIEIKILQIDPFPAAGKRIWNRRRNTVNGQSFKQSFDGRILIVRSDPRLLHVNTETPEALRIFFPDDTSPLCLGPVPGLSQQDGHIHPEAHAMYMRCISFPGSIFRQSHQTVGPEHKVKIEIFACYPLFGRYPVTVFLKGLVQQVNIFPDPGCRRTVKTLCEHFDQGPVVLMRVP